MRILFINIIVSHKSIFQKAFHRADYNIDYVTDLLTGDRALALTPYCAVIIEMPPQDTRVIQMLSRWRRKGVNTPVMILSYERQAARRVAVINAGADDCVEMPGDPEELVARIRAIVRRGHAIASSRLHCGDIVFDTTTREVFVDKNPVSLTAREKALLEIFMMHDKRMLSKKYLEEKMYSWQKNIGSNVVEVFVSGLRKKMGRQIIRTIPGQGYILTGDSEKQEGDKEHNN